MERVPYFIGGILLLLSGFLIYYLRRRTYASIDEKHPGIPAEDDVPLTYLRANYSSGSKFNHRSVQNFTIPPLDV